MKRKAVKLAAVMMLAIAMCVNVFAVSAIDENEPLNLTVTLASEGVGLSGVTVKIYKAADTNEFAYPTLATEFEGCEVKLQPDNGEKWTAENWSEKATTLYNYVLSSESLTPTATATTDSDGNATFESLKRGFYLVTVETFTQGSTKYTVSPYLVSVPGYSEGDWVYDVVSNPKAPKTETTTTPGDDGTPGGDVTTTVTRSVLKRWREDDAETRPGSVTVQLYRNGTAYGSAVTLSESNNWRYTWSDLSASYTWELAELDVPEGYIVTVEQDGITFVVTNTGETDITDEEVPQGSGTVDPDDPDGTTNDPGDTSDGSDTPNPNLPDVDIADEDTPLGPGDPGTSGENTPDETPDTGTPESEPSDSVDIPEDDVPKDAGLPQTGQLWWPVPVLAIGGVVCVILGVLIRKKKNEA